MKLKIGDKVKCIESKESRWLTVGKIYTITGFNSSGNPMVRSDDNAGDVDMLHGKFKKCFNNIWKGKAKCEQMKGLAVN